VPRLASSRRQAEVRAPPPVVHAASRYELKTPWRKGTTHVEFEPIEFMAKLAALVPPPRAHLTRFHGEFAPNANLRARRTVRSCTSGGQLRSLPHGSTLSSEGRSGKVGLFTLPISVSA